MIAAVFPLRPRWVVPVLPKGELEVLLEAAIDLSKKGRNAHRKSSLKCADMYQKLHIFNCIK